MKIVIECKGGSGSGNFGHAGRPGKVGGSMQQHSEKDKVLLDYLGQVSKLSEQSAEHFVLTHGVSCKPQELPAGYKYATVKECFRNAYRLADTYKDLTYVEGYAMPDFIDLPIMHAWVIDKKGNVIDNTWKPAGTSYIGIPFSTDFMRKVALSTGVYGVIGYHSKKFFKDGMPEDALAAIARSMR